MTAPPLPDAAAPADLAPAGAAAPPGVRLLHVDARVVVADKPPGMLVHRSRQAADRDVLLQRVRDALGAWVTPVHRIDRPCSGALVLARDPAAARELQAALGAADALKAYLAVVRGTPPAAGVFDGPLTDHRAGVLRPARSRFVRLAALPAIDAALVAVRLDTGRRHQIRRHFARAAHQLAGDTQYGKGWFNRRLRAAHHLPRLCLHAWRIDVAHPDGGRLACTAPLAPDLAAFLARVPGGDAARAAIEAAAEIDWPGVAGEPSAAGEADGPGMEGAGHVAGLRGAGAEDGAAPRVDA